MAATRRDRDLRYSKAFRMVKALGRLGPDDIADLLYALDCEGQKGDERSCPLARFVNLETGVVSARVSTDPPAVILYGRKIKMPDSVAEFVVAFDCGRYPALVRASRRRRRNG